MNGWARAADVDVAAELGGPLLVRHISLVGPVAGADAEVVLGVLGERSPGAVSLLGHLAVDKVLLVCPIILRGDVRPFVERDADGAPPAPTPPIRL